MKTAAPRAISQSIRRLSLLALMYPLLFVSEPARANTRPGHVSFIDGHAVVLNGNVFQSEVGINDPVTSGDSVLVLKESRLEMRVSPGFDLRLGPESRLKVVQLDQEAAAFELDGGDLSLSLPSPAPLSVSAAGVVFEPLSAGKFRISLKLDKGLMAVVLRGSLRVDNGTYSRILGQGERIDVQGPADSLNRVYTTYLKDAFDFWNEERDRLRAEEGADSGTLSLARIRMGQLDTFGSWENSPIYGWVWWPRVSSGWAPYRQGRWIFRPSWGWTWVSSEAWGWLPYHYGSWIYFSTRSRWCWAPGRFSSWSPARVLFFRSGASVGWRPIILGDAPGGRHRLWGRLPWRGRPALFGRRGAFRRTERRPERAPRRHLLPIPGQNRHRQGLVRGQSGMRGTTGAFRFSRITPSGSGRAAMGASRVEARVEALLRQLKREEAVGSEIRNRSTASRGLLRSAFERERQARGGGWTRQAVTRSRARIPRIGSVSRKTPSTGSFSIGRKGNFSTARTHLRLLQGRSRGTRSGRRPPGH